MTALPGIPQEFASVSGTEATLRCEAGVYPLDVVYAATYTLLHRFYVHLDREGDTILVRVTPRDSGDLRTAVGVVANELLVCAARRATTQAGQTRIEATTTAAMAGAMGEPSLDDLANFDFSDDGFEDPLGIASSWEETHGKSKPGTDEASDED